MTLPIVINNQASQTFNLKPYYYISKLDLWGGYTATSYNASTNTFSLTNLKLVNKAITFSVSLDSYVSYTYPGGSGADYLTSSSYTGMTCKVRCWKA